MDPSDRRLVTEALAGSHWLYRWSYAGGPQRAIRLHPANAAEPTIVVSMAAVLELHAWRYPPLF